LGNTVSPSFSEVEDSPYETRMVEWVRFIHLTDGRTGFKVSAECVPLSEQQQRYSGVELCTDVWPQMWCCGGRVLQYPVQPGQYDPPSSICCRFPSSSAKSDLLFFIPSTTRHSPFKFRILIDQ
jgi:hypothetical protein